MQEYLLSVCVCGQFIPSLFMHGLTLFKQLNKSPQNLWKVILSDFPKQFSKMPGDKKLETSEELWDLFNDLERLKGGASI